MKETFVTICEFVLHSEQVLEAEDLDLSLSHSTDRELPLKQMLVLVPLAKLELISLSRSNNVNNTEVVTNHNVYIFSVQKRW